LCTGTLVSPNVVLTAAHCLDGQVATHFVLGASVDGLGSVLPVRKSIPHPEYALRHQLGATVAWHDIGVAVLETPAPVPPMRWRRTPLDGAAGTPVTFVGFGRTHPGAAEVGVKYRLQATIDEVWDHGFWNRTSPDDPHNTCHGDSGGPAIVTSDGEEQVAGVVSSGDAGCIETGYNSRVDVDASFVAEMVGLHPTGGPDVPGAPPGNPADGTGADPCAGLDWEGCCDGQRLRWCDTDGPHELDCDAAPLCGWDEDEAFYDCGTDGGDAPGGSHAKECAGPAG
jgi:hypothetical protein